MAKRNRESGIGRRNFLKGASVGDAAAVASATVAHIFAYLQSLPGPRPVADVPILND
jgi:hypothetical protein